MTINPCFRKKSKKEIKGYLGVRITVNRKSKIKNIGEKIHQKYWNPERHEVRKSHPNSIKLNRLLREKIQEIENSHADEIVELDSNSFMEYYKDQMQNFDISLSSDTMKSYKSTLTHLNGFLEYENMTDLRCDQIDKEFVLKFKNFLLSPDRNLRMSTISKYFKHFKTIYRRAVESGLPSNPKDPFFGIKVKVPKKMREYLTINQIKNLISYNIPKESKDEITRMKFLVQFFGQGLRISDLFTLRYKDIIVDSSKPTINFYQYKNSSRHAVYIGFDLMRYLFYFISPEKYYEIYNKRKFTFSLEENKVSLTVLGYEARHIIFDEDDIETIAYKESVRNLTSMYKQIFDEQLGYLKSKKETDPNEFLVPGLDKNLFKNTTFAPQKRLSRVQQAKFGTCKTYYNKDLKDLEKYIKSGINITGHTARHSFAKHQLELGVGIEVIRRLLGHTNIKVTQDYLRGFDSKIIINSIKKSQHSIMLDLINEF